ncbi:unnamed protein product [Lactuca virosa]|uniref:Uroporphyrinogen-III synthase n=1 Tax=Lactuca virosa TaxID=75947 RepID=A0AAU9P865_9ASTR|nr:unnamed protein product [Lactuca virosa]
MEVQFLMLLFMMILWFSASADNTVTRLVFDHEREDLLGRHDAHVRCIEYSYATGQVITGSWDKTLKCWDPRGGEVKGSQIIFYAENFPSGDIVALVYLWNPLTIITCLGYSTSPIENLVTVLSIYGACMSYALSSVEGRVAMEFFDAINRTLQFKVTSPEAALVFLQAWNRLTSYSHVIYNHRAAGTPNVKVAAVGTGTATIFHEATPSSEQFIEVAFTPSKATGKVLASEPPKQGNERCTVLYPASAKVGHDIGTCTTCGSNHSTTSTLCFCSCSCITFYSWVINILMLNSLTIFFVFQLIFSLILQHCFGGSST